jgi:hypothetical protein
MRFVCGCLLASCHSCPLVSQEPPRHLNANIRLPVNLSAGPDTDLQNVLELVCRVIPPVVVAQLVSWQIIVDFIFPAHAVSQNMVGLPGSSDLPADVTSATRLSRCSPAERLLPIPGEASIDRRLPYPASEFPRRHHTWGPDRPYEAWIEFPAGDIFCDS